MTAGPQTALRVAPAIELGAIRLGAIRLVIVANLAALAGYIGWRMIATVNWDLWPFAVAMLGAELFSAIETALFCLGVWRIRTRGPPPPAPSNLTVDVFITCYNEPVELVRGTARAARAIRYPHATWVLDDGDSADIRQMAEEERVGYLTRAPTWLGRERHAKAGNLINALNHTKGEFILVLDADHVPQPEFLDRTLGYFRDPLVALVQTPQAFSNIPSGDPFGVDAPLFYGPILQGKDGWNAAFFCGSNAVLRRDALMRVGLATYAREMRSRVRRALQSADADLRRAGRRLDNEAGAEWAALRVLVTGAQSARSGLASGEGVQDVTWKFQQHFRQASNALVADHAASIDATLASTPGIPEDARLHPDSMPYLSARENSPLRALSDVHRLLVHVDLDRTDEAEAVQPLATISVTEDMATAMRLHAAGYSSVYHHEVLATGLAPTDLRSALQQRLRWAQGTMQVLLRENPLTQPGLTLPQRLLYFATMWTYLSGFASVIYLLAPALFLLFGWLPITALDVQFICFWAPCITLNQLLFFLVARGAATWRGQQYSLALFPLWITAVVAAFRNTHLGARLAFVVTPKTRQGGAHWSLIRPQMAMIALLAVATARGVTDLAGGAESPLPILINVVWALYGITLLSAVVRAARWHPPHTPEPQP